MPFLKSTNTSQSKEASRFSVTVSCPLTTGQATHCHVHPSISVNPALPVPWTGMRTWSHTSPLTGAGGSASWSTRKGWGTGKRVTVECHPVYHSAEGLLGTGQGGYGSASSMPPHVAARWGGVQTGEATSLRGPTGFCWSGWRQGCSDSHPRPWRVITGWADPTIPRCSCSHWLPRLALSHQCHALSLRTMERPMRPSEAHPRALSWETPGAEI